MRTADYGNNEWAMACIVDAGGGVVIIDSIFLLSRQSHHAPRIVTVPVLLLVGMTVRVKHLYLSPQICKYQFLVLTSQVDPVEYCIHTMGFWYKSVPSGNVYLNPS
jgi:hypothetical protein